jgi:hypothetical protein
MTETICRYKVCVGYHKGKTGWCDADYSNDMGYWLRLFLVDGSRMWWKSSELKLIGEEDYADDA